MARKKKNKRAEQKRAEAVKNSAPPKSKEVKAASPVEGREKALVVFVLLFVALFASIALTEGIGRSAVPSGDAALVEDVPSQAGQITLARYDAAFERAWRSAGLAKAPKRGEDQYDTTREAALNDLLDQAWIDGQAAEMGITATDREVRNELSTIKETQFPNEKAYLKFLRDSGLTEKEVQSRVRLQVLSRKIEEEVRSSAPKPSEEEIQLAYEDSIDQYTTPEERSLLLISTSKKADAKKIEAALAKDDSEKSFEKLARQYSEDPSRADGGKTSTSRGSYPPEVVESVSETVVDKTGGPVSASDKKTYFFRVTEVVPEEVKPLDEVRKQIVSQLQPTLEQQALTGFIRDYSDKWVSRTVCLQELATSRCSNYESDNQNQQADPACYDKEALEKKEAKGEVISCPAPVVSSVPIAPGANADVSPSGELLTQPVAQGPIPPAGTPAPPTGVPGQPVPVG